MKKVAYGLFSLFIIGFLMCCSYFLIVYMSGTHLITKNVFDLEDIKNSQSSSESRRDADNYKPVLVELSPEMELIAISLVMERKKTISTAVSEYELEILDPDGKLFQTKDVSCSNRKSKSSTSNTGGKTTGTSGIYGAGRITVSKPGEYELRLKPKERQQMGVMSLDLRLMRNAMNPPLPLLFIGFGIAIFGMFSGLFVMMIATLNERSELQAQAYRAKKTKEKKEQPPHL